VQDGADRADSPESGKANPNLPRRRGDTEKSKGKDRVIGKVRPLSSMPIAAESLKSAQSGMDRRLYNPR
jgi:hypothetical protein